MAGHVGLQLLHGLVPTSADATTGWRSTQASASCARLCPRAAATSFSRRTCAAAHFQQFEEVRER